MPRQRGKRVQTRLRLALTGPTNAGKTYSALRLAYGIVKETFPTATDDDIWGKICVVDTERDRALFYIDRTDLPLKTGQFYHIPVDSPYTIAKYLDAVSEAQTIVGEQGVIIVDSLTHAWAYKGGVLEVHQNMVAKGKNSFTSWNEAGSLQNDLIDTIMSVKSNLICTMRSKMDYVLELNAEGKNQPVKKGLKPIQREDAEYEFDITLMLDNNNLPTIIKDTTFLRGVGLDAPLNEQLGSQIIQWLNKGEDPKRFEEEKRLALIDDIKKIGAEHPELITMFKSLHPNWLVKELTIPQAKIVINEFKDVLRT